MTKPKKGYQNGFLTLAQKAELIKYADNNPRESHDNLAKSTTQRFKMHNALHRTTVGRILKRKTEFEQISPYDQSIKCQRIAPNSHLKQHLSIGFCNVNIGKFDFHINLFKPKLTNMRKH